MIVIVGATGNTGRVVAERLLSKGEQIRVVGRNAQKMKLFEKRDAQIFSANFESGESVEAAFKDATAAYLLIPPDMGEGFRAYQERVSDAFATAIRNSNIHHVVALSSLGAQHPENTGPIVGLHNMEEKLRAISKLNVLYLRAASFMENLLRAIPPLHTLGTLPGAAPADVPSALIAAQDIGSYAAKRLAALDFEGSSVQELLGPRDYTMREVATIIGKAIDKPNLGYTKVPFMMLEGALVLMGIPKSSAALMIEMFKAENDGLCRPQHPRSTDSTTPTTLESFALEVFAPAFFEKTATP